MGRKISLLIFASFCLVLTTGLSQSQTLGDKIDSDQVDGLSQELNYSKTKSIYVPREHKTKERKKDENTSSGTRFLLTIIYYTLIIAVILIVLFILIFSLSNFENNSTIDGEVEYTDEEEEIIDIHDIDLESMLARALDSGDYRMALRTQFLIILRIMSSNNYILWSKEKTNREYSRELYSQSFYPNFQYVSNLFDRAWYGQLGVDKALYASVMPYFEDLKAFVNIHNQAE